MGKQITIKEIAARSGVSRATVDRVLHQRGKVSEENRAKIEDVLAQSGYRYNIHTSAVSLRKSFSIAVVTPEIVEGEYWSSVKEGIIKAGDEYSDIDLAFCWYPYDQFSKSSLQDAYRQVLEFKPDAVITAAGFESQTLEFCSACDKAAIPYAFVDSKIDGTHPIASYTADQPEGGYIAGKILDRITPPGSMIAVFCAKNEDNAKSYNASQRLQGLLSFFSDNDSLPRLLPINYIDMHERGLALKRIRETLSRLDDIGGIAVMNSRGHLVCEALDGSELDGRVKVVAFDCTQKNRHRLLEGDISVLLSQRPEKQGFEAVRSVIEFLLYKTVNADPAAKLMPIDILLKENIKYYGI